MSKLEHLNQGLDIEVIEYSGSCAEKSVTKQADCIASGDLTVESRQIDVTGKLILLFSAFSIILNHRNVTLCIIDSVILQLANIKRKEVEDKIMKKAMVENFFTAQEAKEKIDFLNKNSE